MDKNAKNGAKLPINLQKWPKTAKKGSKNRLWYLRVGQCDPLKFSHAKLMLSYRKCSFSSTRCMPPPPRGGTAKPCKMWFLAGFGGSFYASPYKQAKK